MLYRAADGGPEVLLVHPGGPFWAKKDLGTWSIPKGEYEPDEDPRAAALREFEEETGTRLPTDELVELGPVVQKGGKEVTAWAPNPAEAIARMHRALWEFRIRGVATNLRFLDQVITHPKFANAEYTTKFIDETPELFKWEKKRDRATRVLPFIGDTIVNGNPEVKGRLKPKQMTLARLPKVNVSKAPPPGTKQLITMAPR